MKYNPDKYHRRSIRLKGYDYSKAGAYFVTICTQNRECLFGNVVDGEMRLNDAVNIVRDVWDKIPEYFQNADIDEFIVMPNHMHGIIILVGAQFIAPGFIPPNTIRDTRYDNHRKKQSLINQAPTATTVGEIVRAFKARCTHTINKIRKIPGNAVWQRNYYEHIIRNEEEMDRIREYIIDNPAKWAEDKNNPIHCKGLIDQTQHSVSSHPTYIQ